MMRSKGVVVVMLSQGVEDYKTKDFDFASQVKKISNFLSGDGTWMCRKSNDMLYML